MHPKNPRDVAKDKKLVKAKIKASIDELYISAKIYC